MKVLGTLTVRRWAFLPAGSTQATRARTRRTAAAVVALMAALGSCSSYENYNDYDVAGKASKQVDRAVRDRAAVGIGAGGGLARAGQGGSRSG